MSGEGILDEVARASARAAAASEKADSATAARDGLIADAILNEGRSLGQLSKATGLSRTAIANIRDRERKARVPGKKVF